MSTFFDNLLRAGTLPELNGLEEKFSPKVSSVPEVKVELPRLADYDALIEAAA